MDTEDRRLTGNSGCFETLQRANSIFATTEFCILKVIPLSMGMTTHLYFSRLLVLISENIHDQVLDRSYSEIFSYLKNK